MSSWNKKSLDENAVKDSHALLMAAGFLPVSIAKENRLEYFEVLEAYAVNGNLRPFADMIAELEEKRLDEYLRIVQE